MKRQKMTKWIFLLAMVLMVSILEKPESAEAKKQETTNYHLIPCDDGQSGTDWIGNYLYWVDSKQKKISRYSDSEMTKEEVLVTAEKGTYIGPGGLVFGDLVYYVIIDSKTHVGKLYSYDLKLKQSVCIGNVGELQALNDISDGKIYGYGYTKANDPEVITYDLKNKRLKRICKNGYFGEFVGNYVIINTNSGDNGIALYKKTDGKQVKNISSNCYRYEAVDDMIYFVEPIAEFRYRIKSYNIKKNQIITYGNIKANEFGEINKKYLYYAYGTPVWEWKYYKYSFTKKKSIRISEEEFGF